MSISIHQLLSMFSIFYNNRNQGESICLKDHPETANYKPKGMNLCHWNCRRYGKLGGGVCLASESTQHRRPPIQSSYMYNWLRHSDFKSEKQLLPRVWLKPTHVREARLCFISLMLGKIDDIVISEGCKESICCSVFLVVKNFK